MISFNVPVDTQRTNSENDSPQIEVYVVSWFNGDDEAGVYVSLERALTYITDWVNHEPEVNVKIELLKIEENLYHVLCDGKQEYWIVKSHLRF